MPTCIYQAMMLYSIRLHFRVFSLKKLNVSSLRKSWVDRQKKDPYVEKAKKLGFPSRSIFKIQEINKAFAKHMKYGKVNLFQTGDSVLDLGCSPGSWSMYAAQQIGKSNTAKLVSVDLTPMSKSILQKCSSYNENHLFIHGDFTSHKVQSMIKQYTYRVVMSDMAVNFTGDYYTDALRTLSLCEDALLITLGSKRYYNRSFHDKDDSFVEGVLEKDGIFICKLFSVGGNDEEKEFHNLLKENFKKVKVYKPKSSRKESAETYVLCVGFKK